MLWLNEFANRSSLKFPFPVCGKVDFFYVEIVVVSVISVVKCRFVELVCRLYVAVCF